MLSLGLLSALLLSGCGGDGADHKSSTGAAGSAADAKAPEASREMTAVAPGNAADAAGPPAGQSKSVPGRQIKLTAPSRSVIYTADMRVRAKAVDTATSQAKQLVTAAGGYVETESSTSDPVGATLTFKIPADRYAGVLDQLGSQLGKRLTLRQRAEDVTEQVADVDSRVRSAQATLKSFRSLLDKARTVGEVMNVEQEIAQRQAELEALLSRQKSLAQQTRYGTINLAVEAPGKPTEKKDEGFVAALKQGWDAFTGMFVGLAVVIGWALPFLLLAALVGYPAYRIYRSRRPSATPAPPAPTPEVS